MTHISRRELRRRLIETAQTTVSDPDADFVDALEGRLVDLDHSPSIGGATVVQLHRHISRAVVIGAVAASLTGAVAAAAIVGTARESRPVITGTGSTEPVRQTTTTAVSAASSMTTATSIAVTPTTFPPATTSALPAVVPTTEPVAIPPSTSIQLGPTTTTEVRVPATIALSCVADAGAVTCSWTPGPDGTDHYILLRSRPGGVDGRVLFPGVATTFSDSGLTSGSTFVYLVHAVSVTGSSLAHSGPVEVHVL